MHLTTGVYSCSVCCVTYPHTDSNLVSLGMTTEGIYRISGHAQDTMAIKEKFDKGEYKVDH